MYVVTGGAGFIGSAFLSRLNQEGLEDILVVDELDHSSKWKNLIGKRFLDYLDKDKFRSDLLSGSIEGVKAIIHIGACSSTTESDAAFLMENNYRYSRDLAEWALAKGDVRFIYASSGATYGAGEQGYDDDYGKLEKLRPLNMYGYSKHLFDLWAKRSAALQKIVGLKFFNVYGPNEYHKGEMQSVVAKAFNQIEQSGQVQLFRSYHPDFGDGEQLRDFVYVKDCCNLMWWLLERPEKNGLANCGTGKARSWNNLAEAVFAAVDRPSDIQYVDMPPSLRAQYQYKTEAKLHRLKEWGYDLEFTSLEDGVRDYVNGYLQQKVPYL